MTSLTSERVEGAQVGGSPTFLSTEEQPPWPFFETIRPNGPVVWDDTMKAWLVLDYAHCLEVEMDEDRFASPYIGASDLTVRVKGGWANISVSQGELHQKLRQLHISLLSAKAVAYYREHHVKPIIKWLLDRIVARGTGEADLAADFADQLGPRVIAALFGMPWQDDELVARILHLHHDIMIWISQNITGASKPADGRPVPGADFLDPGSVTAIARSDEINDILLPYIRASRDNPGDDFCGRVWRDGPAYLGEQLDETAVLGICRELFLGGADTTVHGVANCFYMLLTEPDLRAVVEKERGEALVNFVEEAMRYYGSTQFRRRIAQQDCRLAGADIKNGDAVVLLHAAAHRDPEQYSCPAHVDINRPRANEHLAFNKGPRSCVGSILARGEMRASVEAVLDRLPGLRLDPEKEAPRFSGFLMRSWRPLHVRFDT